jgi:hypothetical protein
MRGRALLLTMIAWLALSGCNRARKAEECSRFIDKVNGALRQIEHNTQTEAQDDSAAVAEMRRLADQYDTLANDVGALKISSRELRAQALEYRRMANSAASAARHVATAVESKDIQEATDAQNAFDQIVKQEDQLVARINDFCQKS